ncbi:PD-(D/E)XK nuclease family protein [Spirulina major]|uniref:PD-(D/E)XK nuclease family protein n=1 Tax=Spirulina major TaxID=270636 RepID=UPI000934ABAF|nr:PD-(D/E)XK nuclease family protein [Spirulina major]
MAYSDLLRLSQGQLNTFTQCPRRYQYTYHEQLGRPLDPNRQESLTWGSQFHTLMQQRELGLPVEGMFGPDDPLGVTYQALLAKLPELRESDPNVVREAEHRRVLQWPDVVLTVVYDLLLVTAHEATILDWKTYRDLPPREQVEQNWQTKLYPYVLAATSDYTPEQITMTYWIVGDAENVRSHTFPYSTAAYLATQNELRHIVAQLLTAEEQYRNDNAPFAQVPEAKGLCRRCPFVQCCERQETTTFAPTQWREMIHNSPDI